MGVYWLLPIPLMFFIVAWWASEAGNAVMAIIAAILGIGSIAGIAITASSLG